jgi:hypothetical protein
MFLKNLKYAMRQLRNTPGFTLTAVLTLALGIGASTAVFTVVDSVVLKPLAYRASGELVVVWERVKFLGKTIPYTGPNPRHFMRWQQQAASFHGMALFGVGSQGVALGSGHPQVAGSVKATPNILELLGVSPLLGRGFSSDDAAPGRDHVAILTYPLWQSLFHGDPNVIGKMMRGRRSLRRDWCSAPKLPVSETQRAQLVSLWTIRKRSARDRDADASCHQS